MAKTMFNIWEIANRRAKRNEIWKSGVLVEYIWENFYLTIFKVILGSFSALVSKLSELKND